MKSRLTAVIILFFAINALSGCSDGGSVDMAAATVWEAVKEAIPEDSLPVMMEIDVSALKAYYGLSDSDVIDFQGEMPLMNVAATEILVVRAQKKREAAVLNAADERKAALLEKWNDPDEHQSALVQNCRIVQNGDWLLFVVAETADEAANAFNTCIDSYKN